jgi:hypothetical protein
MKVQFEFVILMVAFAFIIGFPSAPVHAGGA